MTENIEITIKLIRKAYNGTAGSFVNVVRASIAINENKAWDIQKKKEYPAISFKPLMF